MEKKQITIYLDKPTAIDFRTILLRDDRFTSMTDWLRQHVELYIESNKKLMKD
jgi:hypothetical protein